MNEMFHPGRVDLKSILRNVHHSDVFRYFHTVCGCTVFDSVFTLFKLSAKVPNHNAEDYIVKIVYDSVSFKHTEIE